LEGFVNESGAEGYRILTEGIVVHKNENRIAFKSRLFGRLSRGSTEIIEVNFIFAYLVCESNYDITGRFRDFGERDDFFNRYPEFDRIEWDCEVRSFETDSTTPQVGFFARRSSGKVDWYTDL